MPPESKYPIILKPGELSKNFRVLSPKELEDLGITKKTPESRKEAKSGLLSPEQAESIIGQDRYFGIEEVKTALDISLESLPDLPFSQEDLENAKKRREILVYLPPVFDDNTPITAQAIHDRLHNKPATPSKAKPTDKDAKILFNTDWYQADPIYTTESVRSGWRLIPENSFILKDNQGNDRTPTTSLNYAQQTEKIAEYVINVAYENQPVPADVREALDEWDRQKTAIFEQIKDQKDQNQKDLSQKLVNLKINRLFRNSFAEELASALIADTKQKQTLGQAKNIQNTTYWQYRWTNSRAVSGYLVHVGFLDSDGASVCRFWPWYSSASLGSAFSRNEFLETGDF